jgi:hypothetical protein
MAEALEADGEPIPAGSNVLSRSPLALEAVAEAVAPEPADPPA